MKNRLPWIFVFILTCVLSILLVPFRLSSEGVSAPQADKWKEYSFKSDGFAISAPSKPVMGVEKSEIVREIHTYYLKVVEGLGILVIYSPLSPENNKSPGKVLSDGRDGAVGKNGKLVSESPISQGDYPGLDYEILTEKEHFHWRVYVANRKLYQILSYAPPGRAFLPETDRVFESFKLIPGGK